MAAPEPVPEEAAAPGFFSFFSHPRPRPRAGQGPPVGTVPCKGVAAGHPLTDLPSWSLSPAVQPHGLMISNTRLAGADCTIGAAAPC